MFKREVSRLNILLLQTEVKSSKYRGFPTRMVYIKHDNYTVVIPYSGREPSTCTCFKEVNRSVIASMISKSSKQPTRKTRASYGTVVQIFRKT